MNAFRKVIASGLGTGYLPVAPGTWGSVVVVGLYLLALWAGQGGQLVASLAMAAVVVAASIACVALGGFAERAWGGKDPSRCTLDEWAGQALALIWLPLGTGWPDWLIAAVAGFVTFRVFDIVKLPPAREFEKLSRGWGILADDLVSGLYANATSQIVVLCALGELW
ncbi:MAG: phosphatidylglycerophosphatase A [Phycisphaerae bacterium]|nr:phosphatidylglycerophosphatase A [Phycisphaerae bacterium]